MKMQELRGLSADELQTRLKEARQELFNLRFQHATAQLEKTASIPATKKNIARILTAMAESAKTK